MDIVSNNNVMDDRSQYTYYAFISYQRKDEKWAKWLQRKLENYKLPVANAKDASDKKSKYIRPVFRDKTDLTAGPLPDALKEALQQSRYLIVICSPNAVESPWVNEEIETFTKAGRTEFVIPFIVNGEPYSKDGTNECFPDALKAIPKDKEPLGVNIHENGKEQAFIRTVAYMLNVKFDELWNRFERHRRKIRNITFACLAFLALIALGIYDYTRTKVEYYADWVDCNGVAQGVIPLTDEQYSHRYASYKFEYTRVPFGEKGFYSWRLNKVSFVNSKGVVSSSVPDNHPFFYPIQEYKYTDGYVTEIINRDTYNRVVMRYTIKDDYDHKVACLIDMEGKEKHQGSAYLSGSTTAFLSDANLNMSKIKRFHYTRNEKGYITKVTYHANDADELDESAIGDNNNIYGKLFDLDEFGRVTKVTYINHEGNPMTDKYGVGYIRYNNASFECNDTTEYFGSDGKLAYNEHRFARQINKLDKYGNPIESYNEGADGKPCYDYKNIYRQIVAFDENGCFTEIKYYGFDGNLSYCSDNYAIQKVKYDSKGRYIEVSHCDIDDNPCYIEGSYSISKAKYDSKDRIIETRYFDIEGNPCIENVMGSHIIRSKYDEYNYQIQIDLYNEKEELAISPISHFATIKEEFDEYHRPLSSKCFDENGMPCYFENYTFETRYTYDSRGNQVKTECFDIEGNRCICKDGYATINYKYDNYGNILEEKYLGSDNKPIYINMSAGKRYSYYPNGLLKEVCFLDENDSLCINNQWIAIARHEYDTNGKITSICFFDKDTVPCLIRDELISSKRLEYDSNGNIVKEMYFDTKGNMSLTSNGMFAIGKYKYDAHRRIIEYSYYDEKGSPCYYNNSFHKQKKFYNDKGYLIKHEDYGIDGKLCINQSGISSEEYIYDLRGNLLQRSMSGTNKARINGDEGYCLAKYKYNRLGQLTELSFYDNNEQPCNKWNVRTGVYWYSRLCYKYDSKGNAIEYSYFDADGNPSKIQGFAKNNVSYDEYGRVVEQKFKNSKGHLCSGGNHHMAILRYKYSKQHNYVSETFFYDADSVLQAHLYETVEKGLTTRKEFRNKDGKLRSMFIYGFSDTKYAIMTDSVDKYGLNVKRAYFGEDGKLGNIEDGFAVLLNTRDNYGRIIKQELFDAKGKPAHSLLLKYSKRIVEYNERGLIEEEAYYDEKGKYVNTPLLRGECMRKLHYNERGEINSHASSWYISVDGKAVNVNDLYVTRDDQKRKVEGSLIFANVENPGLFKEKGLEGEYCIMEWNEWNLYKDLQNFSIISQESLPKEKHLLMVPFTSKGFGEIIDITFPPGTLGIRLMDSSSITIFNDLVDVYEEYKKLKKQQ